MGPKSSAWLRPISTKSGSTRTTTKRRSAKPLSTRQIRHSTLIYNINYASGTKGVGFAVKASVNGRRVDAVCRSCWSFTAAEVSFTRQTSSRARTQTSHARRQSGVRTNSRRSRNRRDRSIWPTRSGGDEPPNTAVDVVWWLRRSRDVSGCAIHIPNPPHRLRRTSETNSEQW